eukprot:5376045-Lingulodinium_polyedra.AAC.1
MTSPPTTTSFPGGGRSTSCASTSSWHSGGRCRGTKQVSPSALGCVAQTARAQPATSSSCRVTFQSAGTKTPPRGP